MFKKLTSLVLSLITIFSNMIFVSAMDLPEPDYYRMYDYCNALTQEQVELYTKWSKFYGKQFDMDFLAMTITSDDGDDLFGYRMYSQVAQNSNKKNAVFLYIESDGTCNISSYGECTKYFTETVINEMENSISNKFSNTGYYEAFRLYLTLCNRICNSQYLFNSDTDVLSPTDNEENAIHNNIPPKKISSGEIICIFISVAGGFGISFLVCRFLKKMGRNADEYVENDFSSSNIRIENKKEKLIKRAIYKN